MKRDYNIRQIPSKKQILVRSRQQSLKYIASQSQSRVLTDPTQMIASSLMKLSQPKKKLSAKKSLDHSLTNQFMEQKCAWCHANRAQYLDVMSSIEQTLLLSKQWMQGSITNNEMLKVASNNLSNNQTVKEIQQLVLKLMHDVQSLSKVQIQKLMIQVDEFDESQQNQIIDKIQQSKLILSELRKQFGAEINKKSYMIQAMRQNMPNMIVSNLKSRLGFVLRQFRQLKQENKNLRSQSTNRDRQKQRSKIKDRQKERQKQRQKQKQKQKQKSKQKSIRYR